MDVNTFLSHRRSLATPSGEIACTEFGSGRPRCSCTASAKAACCGGTLPRI
jgi:hypothetical protein